MSIYLLKSASIQPITSRSKVVDTYLPSPPRDINTALVANEHAEALDVVLLGGFALEHETNHNLADDLVREKLAQVKLPDELHTSENAILYLLDDHFQLIRVERVLRAASSAASRDWGSGG